MAADQSKLKRLLHELEDVLSQAGPFGFGAISVEPPTPVKTQSVWQVVADRIPLTDDDGSITLERKPIQLEPLPDGTACIRWWGDQAGIEKFKLWAGRAGLVLVEADMIPNEDRFETVDIGSTSTRLAIPDPLMAGGRPYRLIQQLILTVRRTHPESIRTIRLDSLIVDDMQRSFDFERLPAANGMAAQAFQAMCRLRGEPRVVVVVDESEVFLDGASRSLDKSLVWILDCIAKGNGAPVRRKDMLAAYPQLEDEGRLDRRINDTLKKAWPALAELIKSDHRGYWIEKEYLE
jgi:hypothetical protein